MCGDGACVPKDWACDGFDDCMNGTDEDPEFCAGCPFMFLCTNGRCTDKDNVCNGRNNCRDNSDESQLCDVGKLLLGWYRFQSKNSSSKVSFCHADFNV